MELLRKRAVTPRHPRHGGPLAEQAVISRAIRVAAGAFAPGHLGELTRIVPFEMVDDVLTRTGRAQARVAPTGWIAAATECPCGQSTAPGTIAVSSIHAYCR